MDENADDGVDDPSTEAAEVEATYRLKPGLYIIGSLERGLTVYNQQLRAHNLIWSLWELEKRGRTTIGRVAVVGGGIAGLTAAACLLSLFETGVSVTLFEQLWDLCPLQQGSDNRWLHPRIYGWPSEGSRAPGASLPVLNWSEGRASDIARTVVNEFGKFANAFGRDDRLRVFLGLRHFRISAATNEIDWVGRIAERAGAFFHLGRTSGQSERFDTIILATGFGLETLVPAYPTPSYWRNEQVGQPILDGTRDIYLISGFGDGALIDLCRLTIERYRQDTILYELFPDGRLETVEERLRSMWDPSRENQNAFDFFGRVEKELLKDAVEILSNRVRKDTDVVLHISGENGGVQTISHIFGPYSSFLNRMLTFLLFRCGAFSISFTELDVAVRRHRVPHTNVLCRYGAKTLEHLKAMFTDFPEIDQAVATLRAAQLQQPERFWQPGIFRPVP